MANTIKQKRGTSNPGASDLVVGELAINTTDGGVFTKTDGGSVVEIGVSGGGETNLGVSTTTTAVTVTSDTGTNATISQSSGSAAGVMSVAHHDKLDGIESGATGDQTNAEIRAAVEAATDSNVFTDADHTKLNGIAAGAQVNVATNLGKTTSTTSNTITSSTGSNVTINEATGSAAGLMSTTHHNKLDGIESGATADQTAAEIRSLVESASDSNVFTDADHSKLNGIESGATGDQTAAEVRALVESASDSNVFTDADHSKLNGIEANATADQTAAQILTAIKTVDGSGSGLDADTVDGLQASAFAQLSGATFTGDLRVDNDADLRIGDGAANERILIQKADNNHSDHIIFYNGTTRIGEIGCEDTDWLRINQVTANNIYTPRYIRADDGFFVDGTSKGINGSGNFIGGTIAGASDYGTLLRSNADDTATGAITFNGDARFQGGANAVLIKANSDIRFENGNWTGNACKIQHHNNILYVSGGSGGIAFREDGSDRCHIDGSGNFNPSSSNTYDLGTSSLRWRNVYTNDLNLSNEGSANDVDGTWGNYTIQEGEDDLFLINRRSGKKYKFNLTEVS